MASIDGMAMSLLKARHVGMLKGSWMFPAAMLMYSSHPLIFYKSLTHGSMIMMNILGDILSDILVAMIGFFVFGETLTLTQCFGLVLSFIGIALLGAH
jgi:drug/metabolite transporter (DMT)-like permease